MLSAHLTERGEMAMTGRPVGLFKHGTQSRPGFSRAPCTKGRNSPHRASQVDQIVKKYGRMAGELGQALHAHRMRTRCTPAPPVTKIFAH